PQTSQHTHRQKTDIFIKPLISIHSFKKYRQMNGIVTGFAAISASPCPRPHGKQLSGDRNFPDELL
ncbi:hypothetical protein, partial [Rhizobium sp. UGM030330-04]